MHLAEMDPAHRRLALGAMRAVAGADGDEDPRERELLEAASALLGVDAPAALEPEALRAAALPAEAAERVVQAAIFAAMMDGRVAPEEVALVNAFAAAAGVDEPRVRNLAQLAKGHTRLLWLDLARRSFARDVFARALKADGPAGIWKIVGPLLGAGRDPALTERYVKLGELPEDTLGHAYFRFLVDHDLAFPGEPHSVAEAGIWHDVTHVLGGYGVSPEEEVLVVSFIAGFSREDPFFWLFTITLQFHFAVQVSPYAKPKEGLVQPAKVLAAFERGRAVKADLSAPGWDPWPLFPRPLAEVRGELGVPAREGH
ncbi:MAG TPA: hypothetical protein RMH85_27725 [Polyangiaceae bacterium LLY-WYZ-15_(1-7)]|nr:hypothetical protein [Myxococcales bacterium]MAT28923.1 hypothetical protein [Sandaracinus sp.]HJL00926.1 hypothetical protein [Polyangiaceae bacterium LLY-WYZ-15_(1-7)]HJL12300.1 hypothetical protein [Polyangiaceae bacterium LLY-WYZ-15_(1-7)]HJL23173.1 hypothetical protein [Polyangiaceae bacterium LLY-WYZ-15_(1-7)]